MTFTMPATARSVLIVEDEAMIAMMLSEFLEALGHTVAATASDVQEALMQVERGGFDLAILDCWLDGEEVWPVAEALNDTGVPFILSSGGITSEIPPKFIGMPMLAKPYSMAMVADILVQ